MEFYVYCIKDKEEVLYVGGSCNPKQRFGTHRSDTFFNYKRRKHITMEIIQTCTKKTISKREIYWILHFKEKGQALFNRVIVGYNVKPKPQKQSQLTTKKQ